MFICFQRKRVNRIFSQSIVNFIEGFENFKFVIITFVYDTKYSKMKMLYLISQNDVGDVIKNTILSNTVLSKTTSLNSDLPPNKILDVHIYQCK